MYYTYVLQSERDKGYYIGQTNDLDSRLVRHNSGQIIATKYRRPFKIVYSESHKTRSEAVKREKLIKGMKGGIQFKKLINA